MTKLVIFLLFFGLYSIQTVGQMNSDPAPGRSPGPPNTYKSVENADDGHSNAPSKLVTTSPITVATTTKIHPQTLIQLQLSAKRNHQKNSNPSANDVVYDADEANQTASNDRDDRDDDNDVLVHDEVEANPNFKQISKHWNDSKEELRALSETTTTLFDSPIKLKSTTKTTINTKNNTSTKFECTEEISEFLNDVVVIDEFENLKSDSFNEAQLKLLPHLHIDLRLEHNIFDVDAANGINCGLMYKVRLFTSLSASDESKYIVNYSGDFLVNSVSAVSGHERGHFVGRIIENKLPISWVSSLNRPSKELRGNVPLSDAKADSSTFKEQKMTHTYRNERPMNLLNSNKSMPTPACSASQWKDSTKRYVNNEVKNSKNYPIEGSESFNLWILNDDCQHDETIEFRVFFRVAIKMRNSKYRDSGTELNSTETQIVNFKKTFKYNLHKDCQLILREMSSGTLEYTSLPVNAQDCVVHFPSFQNYQASENYVDTPPPGLLVTLQRLNVPCNTGSYIRFSESSTNLCGKLEELPEELRTYHFDVRRQAMMRFYKHPMFSLNFKLVDFCFNVTANNETGEYYIKSRRHDILECYFRFHLPYGNRILLRLVTNNNSMILLNSDIKSSWPNANAGNIFPVLGSEDDTIYTVLGQNIDTKVINLTLSGLSSSSSSSSGFIYENRLWNRATPFISTNRGNNAQILGTASCRGVVIKVFENDNAKWSYCVNSTQHMQGFLIESTGNILSVHLYKAATELSNTRQLLRSSGITSHTTTSDSTKQVLPAIYLSYSARPISELVANCEFGWIAMQQFCISALDIATGWHDGERRCADLGGHLVSIRNEAQQKIVSDMLLKSPGYRDENAYWVGGSDVSYEGDFRWSDGLQFHYTNWFPGWEQHGHYNKQPNDDGLSSQDCIELRRYFRAPPGVQSNHSPLTNSYMWNDRDCSSKNYLICEKAMSAESLLRNWINDCNKTVSLTKEHPRASIWSPSFPRQYPDNANCFTTITAPAGYRIVIEFEELVIENEPGCTYDYLEISEPNEIEKDMKNLKMSSNNINLVNSKVRKRNSYDKPDSVSDYVSTLATNLQSHENTHEYFNNDRLNVINPNTNDNYLYADHSFNNFNSLAQSNYQKLLFIFSSLYKEHNSFIIQTPEYPKGNPYLHHSARFTANEKLLPKRLCGDWSSKLKLLRYVSSNSYLGLHFVSDYSHHFGGYKAKTYMENTASECANERLKPYNGSCYLFVSYPEVDWWTAQQVCRAMGAKLSSVSSADEHRFITANIRNQIDYSPQLIYWLGAELENNGQFEWTDDSKMSFQGWLPGQGTVDELPTDATCLGLQWKMSPTPMLPSGLYWQSQKCNKAGGYVCKKPKESFGNFSFHNFTVNGKEGRLVSPAYPNSYPLNIDYWIHIKSPERTRIVVQFQKIDLEPQDECLYDYVSLQDYDSTIFLEPGSNPMPMAMLASDEVELDESNDSDLFGSSTYKTMQTLERRKRGKRKKRRRKKRSIYDIKNTAYMLQELKPKTRNVAEPQHKVSTTFRKARVHTASDDKQHISIQSKRDLSSLFKMKHNPKRRRRKRKVNKFEYENETFYSNNLNRGQRSTLFDEHIGAIDNAQTFLPYVRWCGAHDANMSKFDFVSKANEVVLNFHSDYSITGLGFAAVWKAIDISACPLQTLTAREGSLTSPNYPHFVLNNLNCAYVIQAPTGKTIWVEFLEYDLHSDSLLELDLGHGNLRPFTNKQHLNEGIFVSLKEQLRVQFRTGQIPRGKGFRAVYRTVGLFEQRERVINLTSNATGYLYQLNYPNDMPENVDFIQHLVAPFGDNILLEMHGVEFRDNGCSDNNIIEIYDNYADNNGTKWQLCKYPNELISENSEFYENDDTHTINDISGKSNFGQDMHFERTKHAPPVFITSYLNTLHIRQHTTTRVPAILNATVRVQWDNNFKLKLVTNNRAVEACQPNPCQHNGKCVTNNGTCYCQCQGHYTGRFCGLTLCELEPCIFGKCELTTNGFKCLCQPGYTGTTCEQKQRPCAENPCEGRGICFERNGSFFCRCHAWWEGQRCERRMLHIPYKPLSERMLQEPFWLGLITVFVVMAVIGLVWCAKRHFPEKIEKLLAEEADRNRPPGTAHGHHHHTSLREQLQFTTSTPTPTAVNNVPGPQRSIFNRLGIRKPSLLSLSSPNPTPSGGGAAARTFSLDDLLRPPPRRSPSPRKKRNNSTPVKKVNVEKVEILQHLVSPVAATNKSKLNLGELISMSDNRIRTNLDSESDLKETTFSENSGSLGSTHITRNITDPKLEKKVTFARLLNKVSAEMSSGSEIDIGQLAAAKNSSALSLPTDIQFRTCSMPPSPCTNDLRSQNSTSSNQGSESLSSSDLALTDFGLRSMQTSSNDMGDSKNNSMSGLPMGNPTSRYRIGMAASSVPRPKVSSADSILAMFRHLAVASSATSTTSTAVASNPYHNMCTTSSAMANTVLISPSTTPTVSSPQDDAPGDDESSTSSMYTPVSYSSGPSDSPILYRNNTTIEVPVLDVLNAHKTSAPLMSSSAAGASNNLLHPPTILLEIPNSGINKCLSPIRELPTPMPSPALTPIMPRPQRVQSPVAQNDPIYTGIYSDDEERASQSDDQSDHISDNLQLELPIDPPELNNCDTATSTVDVGHIHANRRKLPILRLSPATPKSTTPNSSPVDKVVPLITIDVVPPTPDEKTPRPRDLIIPTLTIEQPSPTKNRYPLIIFPGSPPPQRASIGETSFMFPNKQQQKRLLRQFEKPTSLDFSCDPPMITVTANMSELESDDTEPISPALKIPGSGGLMPPNPVGMCYLSPFTMCSRADRTISESNLSSSGYSSMASPGTSRCGSSNPLYPNDMEDPSSGHGSGHSLPLHANLMNRRKNATLPSCMENINNGKTDEQKSVNTAELKHQQRPRSDSETFSDEMLLESNDEGISTDHVDEKLDESRLTAIRCKDIDLFNEEHMLLEVDEPVMPTNSNSSSSSTTSTAAIISCTQPTSIAALAALTVPQAQSQPQMAHLQLPAIIIQIEGNDRGLSPVSSRSESPLSERTGMGRFSPHFYGRKDLLPFTDSDGLYDFPSSDGKGASAPLYTHQRRSSSKKRERKSSKSCATQSPTKQLDSATKDNFNNMSSPSSCSITHVCNKYCHSYQHPCPVSVSNGQRKSPKRRLINRMQIASSSSSSESITSTKEMIIRPLPRRLNSPNREKRIRKQESLSEDEVADALLRRISPSIVKEEHAPKPKCKINRLRAIGNQIRFLRRLEKSIKTRERIVSPSDSCPEENTDELESPQATSPLLQPPSPNKARLALCRQKRLPSESCNWQKVQIERNLMSDDLNSD